MIIISSSIAFLSNSSTINIHPYTLLQTQPQQPPQGGKASARWLGAFYSAIPVGTAVGYTYGAFMAATTLGWSWAFFVEGIYCSLLLS